MKKKCIFFCAHVLQPRDEIFAPRSIPVSKTAPKWRHTIQNHPKCHPRRKEWHQEVGTSASLRWRKMTHFFGTCLATLFLSWRASERIDSQNRVHHRIRRIKKCIFFALASKTNCQMLPNKAVKKENAPQKSAVLKSPTSSACTRITLRASSEKSSTSYRPGFRR